MNIGLYFGSFNPIHHGHLIIANHIVQTMPLDEVWFIVSPQNPFKPAATLLNENHRYFLVQEAIEGEHRLKASNVEFHLPKPSYTIHTLTYLQEQYPKHRFHVIMGSDSFQNITRWKNGELILKNYPIIIYKRPGFVVEPVEGAHITIADAPLLEISSTHIRELIKRNQSIRYLVPDAVIREIEKGMYYKK
ncbi:MAG TPA: nicotinic acid mononucleotide adenylyltransferase [Chitinophagaceae bacterium]|nr:nicotinic acid mononucleotide adenylyltransferase [Chitinophagaceae bacterium]HML58568.1 nicotinate (nicotinamide) nucleotide adenylyltransferase [Ferruginibacter sp.]